MLLLSGVVRGILKIDVRGNTGKYKGRLQVHECEKDHAGLSLRIGSDTWTLEKNSLHAFVKMRRDSSVVPDSFTFAFILKGIVNCGSLRAGSQLHCQALRHGFEYPYICGDHSDKYVRGMWEWWICKEGF